MNNDYPKISCFSTVFGRINCLEESMQCFIDQDYPGEKELLILNDLPEQTLVYNDHPEIRIINQPTRFPSLGEKCNYAVRQTDGKIIVAWEDDDFYFPNHLSVVRKLQQQQNNLQLTRSINKLAWRGDTLFKTYSCPLYARHFYRDTFEGVGGYPETSRLHDHRFSKAVAWKYGVAPVIDCDPEDCSFVHNSKYEEHFHLSKRYFRLDANYPGEHDGYRKGYDVTLENMRRGIIPSGTIHLQPHYNPKYDYLEIRKMAIEEEKERKHEEAIRERTITLPSKISCICPTYGRLRCLEEAIECFLRQEYPGEKELIIVNDLADQTLVFDHPEVKIYNLNTRFDSLGEKNNWGVRQSTGDLCMRWDDDDIHLPHHLITIASHVTDNKILRFNGCLCHGDPLREIITPFGRARMQGQFTREAFDAVGGYDHVTWGDDSSLVRKIKRKFGSKRVVLEPEDKSFIWNLSKHYDWHVTDTSAEAAWDIVDKIVKDNLMWGDIPSGIVHLNPFWRFDYCEQYNDFLIREHKYSGNRKYAYTQYMLSHDPSALDAIRRRISKTRSKWRNLPVSVSREDNSMGQRKRSG